MVAKLLSQIINKLLLPLDIVLVNRKQDTLLYRHDYGDKGYRRYRDVQIAHNHRKLQSVWADETTLGIIVKDIQGRGIARKGLCHGARNGWEVEWFSEALDCPVVGTDISSSAAEFENVVQHDFHEERAEWLRKFSFVYTNSHDQSYDPEKAVNVWVDQLSGDGALYIEHSLAHSALGAGEMDPFGAHPWVMPYLLFEWGRGKYRLDDILRVSGTTSRLKKSLWIFVIVPVGRD